MNWFVTEDAEALTKSAPAAPASFWESTEAAWDADSIRHNRRGRLAAIEAEILDPMLARYRDDQFPGWWKARVLPQGEADPHMDRLFALAAADPERPAHFPISRADLDARVTARLKKELDDAEAIGRMGGWWSQTAGGMASATATPLGVGSMLIGGPTALGAKTFIGGVARVAAFEGAMGGTTAAMDLPEQYRMADRLGLERPDALSEIAMGAGGGLVLGAALGSGVRGLDYAMRRRDVGPAPPGVALADHIAATDAAARALATGAPLPPAPPLTATRELIEAVIWKESKGDAAAKGPDLKNASGGTENAWGLMQIRPSTARDPGFGLKGLTGTDEEIIAQLMDPAKNREFGTAYLNAMLKRYGNMEDALAAYNWGPGNADDWIAAGRPSSAAPTQTKDYVRSIRQRMNTADQTAPSAPMDWDRPASAVNAGGVILPPTMRTPAGTKISVQYEIVDLAQLRAASGELQPRDRTRAASREQIVQMAADLDPDLLMPSPTITQGAPLIGPDDIVESGNGRIAAIRMAAESPETGRYAAYLDQLREMGFDVPETGRPVLIARRTADLDPDARRALVTEANAAATMRFSPTEQALVDAEALPMEALARFDGGGQIFTGEGRAFVQGMFARLPQAERAGLYTREGGLNAQGRQRIEAAIFARAYEAPDLIAALTETPGAESAGMIRALTEAAPQWASLRHGIETGVIDPRFDATADLVEAVRTVASARREAAAQKRPVATVLEEKLAQLDLERGERPEIQKALARAFYDGGRPRSAEKVAETLRGYVASARRQSDPTPDLFGEAAEPSALEALAAGMRRAAETPEASGAPRAENPALSASDGLGDLTQPPPASPRRIIDLPSGDIDISDLPQEAQQRLRAHAEKLAAAGRTASEGEITINGTTRRLPPVDPPSRAASAPRISSTVDPLARYSDPASSEADAAAEAHMRELREQALSDPQFAAERVPDADGEELLGPDGEPLTIAGLLADLDADEALAATVRTCGRTR